MDRDEIMALEGVALAEAVAREVMGWEKFPAPNSDAWAQPWKRGKRIRVIRRDTVGYKNPFRPDTDHNHAAEVRARMCELYPGWGWLVVGPFPSRRVDVTLIKVYEHSHGLDGFRYGHPSETIAICRVALLAKAALEGQNG